MSLRGVPDEAISLHGQGIASQSLAMTRSGKWGSYSGYDPNTDSTDLLCGTTGMAISKNQEIAE